jgi:hypothetical protein
MIRQKGPDVSALAFRILEMQELSIPSLFDSPSAGAPPAAAEAPAREERRYDELSKDFIRWCFGFGADFRNSPDVINLRVWCQKIHIRLRDNEEREILGEARRLYFRRLEQMTKKSEPPDLLL